MRRKWIGCVEGFNLENMKREWNGKWFSLVKNGAGSGWKIHGIQIYNSRSFTHEKEGKISQKIDAISMRLFLFRLPLECFDDLVFQEWLQTAIDAAKSHTHGS